MRSPAARNSSPQDRPFVGHAELRDALRLPEFSGAEYLPRGSFWRAVYNTIFFVVFQVGGMVLFSLVTALILNRKIRGRGFFRSIFFYPGAALAGRRRADLEVDPAAQRPAQRHPHRLGQEQHPLSAERRLGTFWVICRQRLGADGLLHADPAGRPAGDSRASSTKQRRSTAPAAGSSFRYITLPLLMPTMFVVLVLVADPRRAGLRPGLCAHRRRAGHGHPVHGPVHL